MTWQPIETAPKEPLGFQEYQEILGFGDGTLIRNSCYVMAWMGDYGWLTEGNVSVQPTHWMPLPPPPAGDA